MNRMARIVLDPNRTYAGTRTAVQLCGSHGARSDRLVDERNLFDTSAKDRMTTKFLVVDWKIPDE